MSRNPNYPPREPDGSDGSEEMNYDRSRPSYPQPQRNRRVTPAARAPRYVPPAEEQIAPAYSYRQSRPSVAPDMAYMGDTGPDVAPANRGSGCGRTIFFLGLAVIALAILGLLAGCGAYVAVAAGLPSTDDLTSTHLAQSTKIYDRNGQLLYEVYDSSSVNGGRRTVVPPEKIPLVLKQATLATEDPTFYTNPGVDWYGIARAIYYDVRYGRVVSGASTITQQLVRNTLITPEVTVQRKIREAVLAMEVTRRYSKDQILAMYLNTIYYGNLSYGIEAASTGYFGKDVDKLDLAEASLLAGLPQGPAIYDPCEDPDAALSRQKVVLGLMVKQNIITEDQASQASSEMDAKLHADDFAKRCNTPARMAAPHFVNYVLQDLEDRYGQEVVYKGGLQVTTTLDLNIQNIAQEEAKKQMAALKSNNVTDAAVVAVNPQNGDILAMLGSADFYDKSIDGQVNVATSPRQPGSSIKPVNYVTALEKGWTPATPILDISTPFNAGAGQPPYVPVNYDGKEHGIVNVRTALGNSLNIPAVKTLYFSTVPNMIATSEKMGITSFKDPSRYGLALTLGGGEVKLIELTGAYAVFANAGKRAPLTPYLQIKDGQGRLVVDNTRNRPAPAQVLDPRYAYLITNILSDNNARIMEFGANSPLKTSRPAFGKTGTTNDFKDNWTLGGTTELVVGVWVGNARNTAMKNVSGIAGAAPIWNRVLERTFAEVDPYKGIAPHDFPVPQGLVRATVCNESGLLPTDLCPPDHRHQEIFLNNQAPTKPDDAWVKVRIDKTNGLLANEQCPADIVEEKVFLKMPQDPVLPYDRVVKWANDHGIPQPPSQQSPCTNQPTPQPTSERNEVRITDPRDGDKVRGVLTVRGTAAIPNFDRFIVEVGQGGQFVQVDAPHTDPVTDGVLARGDTRSLPDGDYTIRLTVFDKNGGAQTDQVNVTVDNQAETRTPKPTKAPPTPEATDTATPPAPPPATPSPQPTGYGPGLYQDNTGEITYSAGWTLRTLDGASGGTVMVASDPAASATLIVKGASTFSVTFFGGPNRGPYVIYLDGQQVGKGSTATASQRDITAGPFDLPDTGQHTISIRMSSGKGTLALDYITVN